MNSLEEMPWTQTSTTTLTLPRGERRPPCQGLGMQRDAQCTAQWPFSLVDTIIRLALRLEMTCGPWTSLTLVLLGLRSQVCPAGGYTTLSWFRTITSLRSQATQVIR